MRAQPHPLARLCSRHALLGAGGALAIAAAIAAPSTELLPGPHGAAETVAAAAVLALAFGAGLARPLHALYGLVVLTVLEGAIRKWLANSVTVFLLKDFLLLGLYAAVLPRLTRAQWRRPWWLVAPLAGILALAVLSAPRSESLSQATIGLRAYAIYLPLLWAAPQLLSTRRRAYALLGLVLGLGAAECVLSVAQALSGASVLNKLVSGALAGLITLDGKAYIRPSGTFMQVGPLSAFLFFSALVAFTLVLAHRRGAWLWASLASVALLAWGVVYTSARSLLGSVLLAFAGVAPALLRRRRFVSAAAVPASFALGFLLLINVVPTVRDGARDLAHWWERRGYEQVAVTDVAGKTFQLELDPKLKAELQTALRTGGSGPATAGPVQVAAVDDRGRDVVVAVEPGKAGGDPKVSITEKPQTVPGVDDQGHLVNLNVYNGEGSGKAGEFLGRAADFNAAGGEVGLWRGRVKPQLDLIGEQRLIGHGPGTMTLGSEYADPSAKLQGESMYSKLAWELGLPGLALFVWLLGAFAVLAARGVARVNGWQRVLAVVGLGAATLLPLWYVLTFALDFPIVAILFGIFGGCAVAYGSGSAPRRA